MYNSNSVVYGLKHQVKSPRSSGVPGLHAGSRRSLICTHPLTHIPQARSLVAQLSETDRHRFFVGTNSVREPNEVHWIEFNEDTNDVTCLAVLPHVPEIWAMATTTACPDLVATAFTSGGHAHGAAVWRIQPNAAAEAVSTADATTGHTLQNAVDLAGHTSRIKR